MIHPIRKRYFPLKCVMDYPTTKGHSAQPNVGPQKLRQNVPADHTVASNKRLGKLFAALQRLNAMLEPAVEPRSAIPLAPAFDLLMPQGSPPSQNYAPRDLPPPYN